MKSETTAIAARVERLGDTICGLLTCSEADKASASWRLEASGALTKADALLREQEQRIAALESQLAYSRHCGA